jgi:hypothetical protein
MRDFTLANVLEWGGAKAAELVPFLLSDLRS